MARTTSFVGRQPIFDRSRSVVAYELLFRSSEENRAIISQPERACADTLLCALVDIGLDELVGRARGFVNVSEGLLFGPHLDGLPKERITLEILEDVRRQVAPRGVIVENVLLRDLQLPETLKHAIEAKQQAQQEAQRMEYVLQREKQEAERKRVEAGGIKDFQDIVSQGISDKLLEWKGIEATMELVKSQNAKVIVVGNSKNGLPLIYSGDTK